MYVNYKVTVIAYCFTILQGTETVKTRWSVFKYGFRRII